jgi:hypothetical protein
LAPSLAASALAAAQDDSNNINSSSDEQGSSKNSSRRLKEVNAGDVVDDDDEASVAAASFTLGLSKRCTSVPLSVSVQPNSVGVGDRVLVAATLTAATVVRVIDSAGKEVVTKAAHYGGGRGGGVG